MTVIVPSSRASTSPSSSQHHSEARRINRGRIVNTFKTTTATTTPITSATDWERGCRSRRSGSGQEEQGGYSSTIHSRSNSADRSNGNMGDRDHGYDMSAAQRKRIAVACGRCRKRKIRCSGDDGTGQPCTNCRNAGHDPCQFLRVSSTETPMRGGEFSYGLEVSRQFQSRGASVVPSMTHQHQHQHQPPTLTSSYAAGPMTLHSSAGGEAAGIQYRSAAGQPYGNYAGGKACYPLAGFSSGYSDDSGASSAGGSVEYSMYPVTTPTATAAAAGAAYQSVQDPGYMMSYRVGPNATSAKPANDLYIDASPPGVPVDNPGYMYGNGPAAAAAAAAGASLSLVHRPASHGGEAGNFPFQSVSPSSIATSMSSVAMESPGDRQLSPPSRRPLPTSAHRPYRADSLSPAYNKHPDGLSNTSQITETPQAGDQYVGFEASSSSLASYNGSGGSNSANVSRAPDVYASSAPTDSLHSVGSNIGGSTHAHGGSHMPEMQYRYTDTTQVRREMPYLPSNNHNPHHGQGGTSYIDLGGSNGSLDGDRKNLSMRS